MKKPRVIFFGSSSFALPLLQALLEIGMNPLVVTRPDKPAHRGKQLSPTPIKKLASELQLSLWQPNSLNEEDFVKKIIQEKPDLIVSAAYGERIPREILKVPRHGAVNVHPSLLPKYRGAAPVQRAIMKGERVTGITLAYVEEKWDAGSILFQKAYPIEPEDTAGTLLDKLAHQGALMLKEAIPLLLEKKLFGTPQDLSQVTYAPKIKDEEKWISWSNPANQILNLIRGLAPSPTAHTAFRKQLFKIYRAQIVSQVSGEPGMIAQIKNEGPVVSAGQDSLLLMQVLPENRKLMTGRDFVNGYHVEIGEKFES